jgi:hypothetical protein
VKPSYPDQNLKKFLQWWGSMFKNV